VYPRPILLCFESLCLEFDVLDALSGFYELVDYDSTFTNYGSVRAIYVRFKLRFDRSLISKFPVCRYIICNATNTSHIDLEACEEFGIKVISLNGESELLEAISSTAELTWFLVLALARRAIPAAYSVRQGEWNRDSFLGIELHGKSIGIVGLGRNGRKVVTYAEAFGMKVYAFDPFRNTCGSVIFLDSIESLCKECDIVCITVISDKSTRSLFSREVLRAMRPHALLINSSRGEVVDEDVILEMLEKGSLGGYASDVLANETDVLNNRLFQATSRLNNLVITPHIGGVTVDAWRTTERFVVERLLSLELQSTNGGTPRV